MTAVPPKNIPRDALVGYRSQHRKHLSSTIFGSIRKYNHPNIARVFYKVTNLNQYHSILGRVQCGFKTQLKARVLHQTCLKSVANPSNLIVRVSEEEGGEGERGRIGEG